jgi:1,4-dihydroxy-2-naphthoyl-CoA hydrolase
MHPNNWLLLCRTVRFGDTDPAGVMHFHHLLRWCHEAYEESLERFGIPANQVFPGPGVEPPLTVALPIVHCSADFLRPLRVGDALSLALSPERLDPNSFSVTYSFDRAGEPVARGLTRHVAIAAAERRRCLIPEPINRWLEAASLGAGIREL